MLPVRILWYVTVLDLGPAGAVYTEGWDRYVVARDAEAKATKQAINTRRIYPPRNRSRTDLLHRGLPGPPVRTGSSTPGRPAEAPRTHPRRLSRRGPALIDPPGFEHEDHQSDHEQDGGNGSGGVPEPAGDQGADCRSDDERADDQPEPHDLDARRRRRARSVADAG